MRVIDLIADDYTLSISPKCDLSLVDFKTDSSLFVKIALTDIWNGTNKTIIFQTYDNEYKVPMDGRSDIYRIPKEVTKNPEFKVCILGEATNLLIRTNEVHISATQEQAIKLSVVDDNTQQDLANYIINARLADNSGEEHITVDTDRIITVPESLKKIGVQYDHNIETVTFDCPRYWDGHDMSEMKVYIVYQLSDNQTGSYPCTNIVIDETDDKIMHFDWTISRNVTNLSGGFRFLVCTKKTDNEGNESVHWNTEINEDMFISEGIPHDYEIALEQYPDLVTHLFELVELLRDGNEVAY